VRRVWKVALGIGGVTLFVLSLKLMQGGARAIAPVIEEHFEVETPVAALGFGWGASYVLLSGSPVAATAVTFLDAEQIDEVSAFAMITGSRLGAAFIVLVLGFFYVLYHREPIHDLKIGLLALIVTASIYLPAFALGYGVLETGILDGLGRADGFLDGVLGGGPMEKVTGALEERVPPWGIFVAGLVLILASFKLLDFSLPSMDDEDGEVAGLRRRVYRRWPMFWLGALFTAVTLSVSVSLGLLVPLHDRRIVRVEHVVPYIMGANITTFVDTLVAAMTMERGAAMVVVLVEMAAVTVISLAVLVFVFGRFEKAMLGAVAGVTASRRNLAIFLAVLLALPAALLILPRL